MSHTREQSSETILDFIFCETCGSCEMERGKKFTFCSACENVYYCSWNCESADLLEHHPLCLELLMFNPATSPLPVRVLHYAERLQRRTVDIDTMYYIKTLRLSKRGAEMSGPYRNILAAAFGMFCRFGNEGQLQVIERIKDGSLLDERPVCRWSHSDTLGLAACSIHREENLLVKCSLPCEIWIVYVEMTSTLLLEESRRDSHDNQEPLPPLASPVGGTFLSAEAAINRAWQLTKWVRDAFPNATYDVGSPPGRHRVFRVKKEGRIAMICAVKKHDAEPPRKWPKWSLAVEAWKKAQVVGSMSSE